MKISENRYRITFIDTAILDYKEEDRVKIKQQLVRTLLNEETAELLNQIS
jgi:hypothetical protein